MFLRLKINHISMSSFVFAFKDIDKTISPDSYRETIGINVVGGKGANLGELTRIEGINVPDGFCISTDAFKTIIGKTSSINELLDQLSFLKVLDRNKIREISAEICRVIEGISIPQDIDEEITRHLSAP